MRRTIRSTKLRNCHHSISNGYAHPKSGGTWRDWDRSLVAHCHKKKSGKTYPSVYGRMAWDEPSPTMTTQFFGFGNGRFGHPQQNRAISLREGAILQSFPRNYKFVAKGEPVYIKTIGRLIGNAVPVKLGKAIGKSIHPSHPRLGSDATRARRMTPAKSVSVTSSPEPGQLVEVRRRQWVVADMQTSPARNGHSSPQHFVTLSSIDEDSLGEQIEVVWEIEPGAHIIERAGLPSISRPGR